MEQSKSMEYGSRKASPGVLKPRNIRTDDVSEGDSIDEGMEYYEDCVEPRESASEHAKVATSDDCRCSGVDDTDSCFIGKDKTKWGKSSRHVRCRWRNILTNLPEVIGQARKAATPFETYNCCKKDEILDKIFQHANQCNVII
jgi:hypothetical protein